MNLRHVLVSVVVTRWSNDLFVISITSKARCMPLMIINRSVKFHTKKIDVLVLLNKCI